MKATCSNGHDFEYQESDIKSHFVMCGDSTDKASVELLMDGVKADMVFTDPPYNVAEDSENYAATASKSYNKLKDSKWDYGFNPSEVIDVLAKHIAKDCFIYMFTSHRLFGEIVELFEQKFSKSSFLVWCKPNPMPSLAKRHWTWNSELCLYATKGKQVFNFINGEHNLSVWTFTKKSDGSHPTQKPIELLANIIQHSSDKGQLVADLFLGSGSTLIACEQTDRVCYGMELDEKYLDVIRKRWAKYVYPDRWEKEWEILTPAIEKL